MDKNICPYYEDTQKEIKELQLKKENFLNLVVDYQNELKASNCLDDYSKGNVQKICCPKSTTGRAVNIIKL